ncbi:hypothetical protein F2Q70_00043929 [Brassica cretica]|uniref:Uncharacterized protein n=1 Tax=Brassica cretica TaxID=69181 RepID=A0A8S9KMA5_BRACR|nr:hypothetical protein F2Q70_00043929 [Brassica cretica]
MNPNPIENLSPHIQGVPDLSTRPQFVPQLATSACSRDTISACSTRPDTTATRSRPDSNDQLVFFSIRWSIQLVLRLRVWALTRLDSAKVPNSKTLTHPGDNPIPITNPNLDREPFILSTFAIRSQLAIDDLSPFQLATISAFDPFATRLSFNPFATDSNPFATRQQRSTRVLLYSVVHSTRLEVKVKLKPKNQTLRQ